MPWVRKGKMVYKRVGPRLVKKQECSSVENAKRALRLLYSTERKRNG